jgi:hypothetical protein
LTVPQIPQVIECGESGSGSLVINSDGTQSRAVVLRWLVGGMGGYDAAETKGKAMAPQTYKGHRRIRLEPTAVGGGWYQITAEYANGSILLDPTEGALGTFGSWQFDFESKTEHITQAYSDSVAATGSTANPNAYVVGHIKDHSNLTPGVTMGGVLCPDYRGAIGVEADGVRGTDIPKAQLTWSETWHFPAAYLTNARAPLKKLTMPDGSGNRTSYEVEQPRLLDLWERSAFSINLRPFRGYDAGEVLVGAPRSPQIHAGQTMASITFSFSVSRTRKNFYVGDIFVPIKGGWDLLDIYYETAAETSELLKKPRVVYCCRILPSLDFADLGVSVDWPQFWLESSAIGHTFDGIGVQ